MEPVLVSASQLTVFRDECERKWFFRSVLKLTSEPHPSAKLGTEVDEEQLQPYLTRGQTFDFSRKSGEIAASAVPFLPKPMTPGLEVQKRIEFRSPSWRTHSFGYLGFIDLWHPDSSVMPDMLGGVPLVSDFKTTSNFKWAKTEETLRTDPQGVIYGTFAVLETGAPAADLAWIYMQTKGAAKAMRRHLRVLRNDVGEQFKRLDEVACGMIDKRKALEATVEAALSLTANLESCDAFGGCPYRVHCQKEIASFPEVEPMSIVGGSFAERLKKQREGAGVPAEPVKTVAAEQPVEQKINPPEESIVKAAKDPLGADAAAFAEDKPKATRAKAAKAETQTVNNFVSDPKIVEALKAAAKAFLEALS